MMPRFGIIVISVLAALTVTGCASLPGGAQNDANDIISVVKKWSVAIAAHDLDALMPLYSENFSDNDGNSKTDLRDFLADTMEQGMLDDLEVDTEDIVLTVDEDTATYTGILLTSAMGSVTVDLTFGREAAGWMIVSMFAA